MVSQMRLGKFLCWCALVSLLTGCAANRPNRHGGEAMLPEPEPYVRIFGGSSNEVQLQIALRKFVPPHRKQPVIWLAGVSHLGESNYYARIQEHLDAQQLVLFEGIGEHPGSRDFQSQHAPGMPANPPRIAASRDGKLSSLQSTMADSLGLVFQLEAIDYNRPTFRNSDLSIQELRQIFSSAGSGAQNGASESFESLLGMMQGGSFFDTILQAGLRILGASRKFQALSKLALMDAIDEIGGDPGRVGGLPADLKSLLEVLIERRNERVITDLKADLREVGKGGSISVFFGTGHMPDMERRLREQLHYRPAGQIWLTAFQVDLARAGVSSTEREFVQNLVHRSLDQFKPAK
jgi:hypothetical protein